MIHENESISVDSSVITSFFFFFWRGNNDKLLIWDIALTYGGDDDYEE